MSVSSFVQGRLVEFDLTFGDLVQIARHLASRKEDAKRFDPIAGLAFSNVDVDRLTIQRALDEALRLPRLPAPVKEGLESLRDSIRWDAENPGDSSQELADDPDEEGGS